MDNIITLSDTFEQIFDELKQEYDCTYLFYCYEDNNGKIVRSSNPDWYKLYFEEGLCVFRFIRSLISELSDHLKSLFSLKLIFTLSDRIDPVFS